MKKAIYAVLIAVCAGIILSVCGSKVENPSGMTAEETVQRFFSYWNEKNDKGMDSLEYEKLPKGGRELYYVNSLKLNSCIERKNYNKKDWNEPWFSNPYDVACVDTNFTIDVRKGSALTSGTYGYTFYLVKESKDADWMIVMYGQG